MAKYIFVVGGVMSGVGKGVTAASLGTILQARGYTVTALKIDPYINVDAGTMNPTEHGEVFVTHDGDETDQDVGNYERFLNKDILRRNYMTTGRVYQSVIQRERNLEYHGKCVEVVPHIPEEVIQRIQHATKADKADITIIEVGGTVGEYQNILFLEAARLLKYRHPNDVAFVLVSFLPVPGTLGEMKTKPTQHAIQMMHAAGIQPDFVVCRSTQPIDEPRRRKISTFGSIPESSVIASPDMESIYHIPLQLEREKFAEKLITRLGIRVRRSKKNTAWRRMVAKMERAHGTVTIGIVGKYFATGEFILPDAYISVIEAIRHAGIALGGKPNIVWINSDEYEKKSHTLAELQACDAVIVPGGFGKRGIEGKIKAIEYVRKNAIPYLGLCYGMQLATIEFARHVAGLRSAHTTEVDPDTKHPVIHIMPDQAAKLAEKQYGNTMRLGAYPCILDKHSRSYALYGNQKISERHRHRYEFNNAYREQLERHGLRFAGLSPDKSLVEVIELPDHPFFIATQFHPEFLSRPLQPHPLFLGLVKAAMQRRKKRASS